MCTVLVYEVKMMKFVILFTLALNLASDLFWSMAITFFRGANLMANMLTRHPRHPSLISFRSWNLVHKSTKYAVILFNCVYSNWANGVDVWTTGNDFDAQGARGMMLQRDHVIFSCYHVLRTPRILLHFRVSFI